MNSCGDSGVEPKLRVVTLLLASSLKDDRQQWIVSAVHEVLMDGTARIEVAVDVDVDEAIADELGCRLRISSAPCVVFLALSGAADMAGSAHATRCSSPRGRTSCAAACRAFSRSSWRAVPVGGDFLAGAAAGLFGETAAMMWGGVRPGGGHRCDRPATVPGVRRAVTNALK
jgi:hypothetical protein